MITRTVESGCVTAPHWRPPVASATRWSGANATGSCHLPPGLTVRVMETGVLGESMSPGTQGAAGFGDGPGRGRVRALDARASALA